MCSILVGPRPCPPRSRPPPLAARSPPSASRTWPRCSWRSRRDGRSMAAAPSSSRRSPTWPPRWWSSASASGTTTRVSTIRTGAWRRSPSWRTGPAARPRARASAPSSSASSSRCGASGSPRTGWRAGADSRTRTSATPRSGRGPDGSTGRRASSPSTSFRPRGSSSGSSRRGQRSWATDDLPGLLDAVALAVTAGGIAVEAVADRQLRRFLRSRRDPSDVLQTGLWRLSRTPTTSGNHLLVGPLAVRPRRGPGPGVDRGRSPLHHPALHAGEQPVDGSADALCHPVWAERMSTSALVPWPRRG